MVFWGWFPFKDFSNLLNLQSEENADCVYDFFCQHLLGVSQKWEGDRVFGMIFNPNYPGVFSKQFIPGGGGTIIIPLKPP